MAGLNWDRSKRQVMMATAATEQRLEEATLQDAAVFGHSGFGGDPLARDDYRDFRESLKEQLYGAASTETRASGPDQVKPPANRQPTGRTQPAPPAKRVPSARVTSPRPAAPSKGPDARLTRLVEEINKARQQNNTARVFGLCSTGFGLLGQAKVERADQVRPILKEHLAWAKEKMNAENGNEPAPRPGPPSARSRSANGKTVQVKAQIPKRRQPKTATVAPEIITTPEPVPRKIVKIPGPVPPRTATPDDLKRLANWFNQRRSL
ncbi:hypothetical protein [Sphaerisporangium perillae]|uniref:hypothetical protein n=1 Tax=Sphaerisporangium perillae TaxID=2935860 RepID=UPI00200C222F|nr:hypothetical protein [Sphaerisporangium perillae]